MSNGKSAVQLSGPFGRHPSCAAAATANRLKLVVVLTVIALASWSPPATGSDDGEMGPGEMRSAEVGSGEMEPAAVHAADVAHENLEGNVAASQVDRADSRPRRRSGRFAAQKTAPVPWYRHGLGALTIVLAAIALTFYLLRRWMPSTKARETGLLRVVARTNITPKQHAALIQLGHRFVLVGVSPDRLTTLAEIRDGDEVAELAARTGARSVQAFDEQLMEEASSYESAQKEPGSRPAAGKNGEPMKDLLAKLRKLRVP